MERKFFAGDIKAKGNSFEGYGAVFGNIDQGGDIIKAGAFASLGKRSVRMLRDHDHTRVIGKYTLIQPDAHGLHVAGDFAETPLGQETKTLVSMGAIEGLSIGYRTIDSERDQKTGARVLKEIDLWEVSVVTFPMNEQAQIDAVKALGEGDAAPLKRIVEKAAREAGFSAREAKAAAAGASEKLFTMRDAGDGLADLLAHMRGQV